MRVLLATEGPTDELTARALIRYKFREMGRDIENFMFPARGIHAVLKLLPAVIKKAHYGQYDLIVVHCDTDGKGNHPLHIHSSVENDAECRHCVILGRISEIRRSLTRLVNAPLLKHVVMAPNVSTDTWLKWARDDGDPKNIELLSKAAVKAQVYGALPYAHVKKATSIVSKLIERLEIGEPLPPSLNYFLDELDLSSTSEPRLPGI